MKRKILSLILIILVAVFAMSTAVNALSFTATMSTNSTTVPEATEFTVRVKVSNLDVGTNGINSLEGTLKYDTDVFETISESSIEGLNSWKVAYDNVTGKVSLTKITFVTSTQEVLSVTFKTKEGVTGKKGNISLSGISASNSETQIAATDISTSITVGTEETPTNNTNTMNTARNTTNNTISIAPTLNTSTVGNTSNNTANRIAIGNNTTNNSSVSSYVNTMTNTSSNQNMPKTGVSDTLLILTAVAIVIALGFYIKIEKLNKDIK